MRSATFMAGLLLWSDAAYPAQDAMSEAYELVGNWRPVPYIDLNPKTCNLGGTFRPISGGNRTDRFELEILQSEVGAQDNFVVFHIKSSTFQFPFDGDITEAEEQIGVQVGDDDMHHVSALITGRSRMSFSLSTEEARRILETFQSTQALTLQSGEIGLLEFNLRLNDPGFRGTRLPTSSGFFACLPELQR